MLTSLWTSGAPPASRRSRSSVTRVAVIDAAAFDRLVPRAAIAQPLQRHLDRFVVDRVRGALERDRRQIARIELRHGVERRDEGQRLPFLDRHVAHVGRVDRLEPLLAQRIVDRARNQIVRDVVKDLILEALLDDARRGLAGPEARDARLARIVARDRGRSRRRPRRWEFRRARSCAFR